MRRPLPANDNRPLHLAQVRDIEQLRERCRIANLAAVRVLGVESLRHSGPERSP